MAAEKVTEPIITTKKIGGVWHAYLEGHPEIDERGLTEVIARRKAERIAGRIVTDNSGREE